MSNLDQAARGAGAGAPPAPEPTAAVGLPAAPAAPTSFGVAGWLRWAWRTLTAMRTAVILLALLALAAVPGSLLPQRGVASSPSAVAGFQRSYPEISTWLDRLGFFEVYSSPWFAAIYLLLLTSMTGCVLPRCLTLWRAARAAPARPPGSLARQTGYQRWVDDRSAADVRRAAAGELRRRRFRVAAGHGDAVSAEKGYAREVGNLGFHLSLLVLLFGVAAGKLYGFEATVIVAEGAGFSNSRSQYDTFLPGPLFDDRGMDPFALTLTDFNATYEPTGPQRGSARGFTADVEVVVGDEPAARRARIEVNKPFAAAGTKIFLTGNGYAPRVTVRDGEDRVVFSGPVVFPPRDTSMASAGVVKVPDARPTQLGFEGFFLPTAMLGPNGPYSAYPDTLDPRLFLTVYTGDLGLGDGIPESVYTIDKSAMRQVRVDDRPLARALAVGDTMTLPDGQGSITLDGVARFANFQVARDPGKEVSLGAAVLLLAGLTVSLAVRRRRVWVRVRPVGGDAAGPGCVVEVATLELTRRGAPPGELDAIAQALGRPAVEEDLTSADPPAATSGREHA